jgi:hypothetical protein
MFSYDARAHSASVVIAADADTTFAFVASGLNQSYWALGSWARVDEGDGVVSGTSLWDGSKLYIRPDARPDLRLVDYYTGATREKLSHGVSARVLPGEPLGHPPGSCLLILSVWRMPRHTDESWRRTQHAFEAEVHLIKGRIETGVDAATRAARVAP